MVALEGNALFYAVLIAPGFIAVMTAVRLAAIEDDISSFVLLVWSLVFSLIIDTTFLGAYQYFNGDITSFEQLSTILFDPYFRFDYIGYVLGFSLVLGFLGAIAILVDIPGQTRNLLQTKSRVKYDPRQPWANFMDDTASLQIRTSDDELFAGDVVEWSRAGRSKEVRIADPYLYDKDEHEFVPVGREDMLFLEKDIDRLLMRSRDDIPSLWTRTKTWGIWIGAPVKNWMKRRQYTGFLILLLFGWYLLQLVVAARIGVDAAAPWFYFTPEPATGWLFAPISHDMTDIGHLQRNLLNLLLVGAFAEPYFRTRKFLTLFFGLSIFSILIPVLGSAVLINGDWLVAGASGGIYGFWAFIGVYRYEVLQRYWAWPQFDKVNDWRMLPEAIMAVFGLLLIFIVPLSDVLLSPNGVNAVSHASGIIAGLIIGFIERKNKSVNTEKHD